ncbi:DUF4012 domain-containing protein [Nitriliruptoraceae bacterium ZYF776]|nr:DUF4012 domain-containing protein [Profundirhabdus halotolerans]
MSGRLRARRRERDRRKRRPAVVRARARRGRRFLVVLGTLVVGGLCAALAVDAVVVARAVQQAQDAAIEARDLVRAGELPAAQDRFRDAREELGAATTRTNRFLWRAAQRVPVAGSTFATLRGIVEVVDEGSGVGARAVDAVAPLIDDDGELAVQPVDGQLPLPVLRAARTAATSLDPTGLERALEELRAVAGPVPGPVAEARDRVLVVADEVTRTLRIVQPVLEAFPTFVGADGPRTYLLGMQNPAELRGTGGLLGFTAVLEADAGRLSISRPQAYSALDALGREADGQLPPVDVPETFAARYAEQNAAGFLGNVNVDPDLPTTAPVLLDLVEDRTGDRYDGLLLVDPIAVAHVLREIGVVEVADDVAALAPELPTVIDADAFPDLVMVEHYAVFAGRNQQRREWLSEVASRAFDAIFDARWDGVPVTRAVLEAAGAGHVALHLRDDVQQRAFTRADLAGALRPPATLPTGDTLAVTANNSAGNKMDRHVRHRIEGAVVLRGDPRDGEVEREAELTVTVDNPVEPGSFGLYVEGSFPVSDGTRTPPGTDRALARTWWSVWGPVTSTVSVRTDEGPVAGSWAIHGQRVADAMLETPSRTEDALVARIVGPAPTTAAGDGRTYTLHLRRQPKAIADELALAIGPPAGWRVSSGTTRGGDAAVGVPGVAPSIEVVDGVAYVTGEITSDLTVQVALVRD